MSIASDRLAVIRKQVENHLDHAKNKTLSDERAAELREQIKARLVAEDAVLVAHYYTAPEIQARCQMAKSAY